MLFILKQNISIMGSTIGKNFGKFPKAFWVHFWLRSNYNVKNSGVYTIDNFCGVKCSKTRVYCDTSSGGGGCTVIQRRDSDERTSEF